MKILRSLYTAFLHKIQMDGSLLQSNDFRIWDSMCKWVSQVEDYLFSNANQDSFEILRIHKDNNGRWADYPLAQTLSEFLDRLIAKSSQVNSPNSSSNNSIQRQVEQFTKLQLNLILASMREADSFISQEKGQLQSEQFDILQKFVSSEKARIKDAVSMFIKAKQNQQTAESQQLSSFLQKNLTKLQRIIDQLLENASESNLNRVLFVTSFLYKTMESSHQQSGVGSDQMFAIFRYILPKIKPENMNFASEEELISYFMNGFTYSDSSFVMTNQFENALKMIFEEQQELFNRRKTRIEQNQKLTLSRIEQEMEKENSSHKKFKHSFELLHDSYCKEERSRRQNFVESLFQSTKSVSSRWSRLKRFLQSDRGPFTNSDLPYQFTLDNTEDLLRRRKLLARTFKKIDHSNAAIEKFRTKILATSLNETSIINEKKQQELIESNNSETDVNIEEIPLHKIVFQIPCELIRPMKVTPGTLQMTSTNLYFLSQRGDKKQWSLEQVIKLYSRRYVLQWTAFEIFLQNHKNYFFNFQTKKEAEATMKKLLSLCYNITETCSFDKHPKSLLSKLKLTELWQQKKICKTCSNFFFFDFLCIFFYFL